MVGQKPADIHYFNDTFILDPSTWTWTEVKCKGEVPGPRAGHAAEIVGSKPLTHWVESFIILNIQRISTVLQDSA